MYEMHFLASSIRMSRAQLMKTMDSQLRLEVGRKLSKRLMFYFHEIVW